MDYELNRLKAQVAVLRDVLSDYPTSTLSNAITQIESRIRHIENKDK